MFTSRSKTMHLDTRDLARRMALLNTVIMPAKIKAGLTAAGNRLMIDVEVKSPTIPIRRPGYEGAWSGSGWSASDRRAGELRASGALFVDGIKKRTTLHYGEFATGRYQPESYGGTPILPTSHEACVVFNAPYAAEQHEQWPDKTQSGADMYFMSDKLYTNSVEYIGIIAKAVRL